MTLTILFDQLSLEWEGFLVNNRFSRRNRLITWENYRSKYLDDNVTASNVLEMIDDGQYTFQVATDGSIFQIYYRYDTNGKNVNEASLRKFFASGVVIMQDDSDIIESPPDPDLLIGWFRLDYSNDPERDKGILHPKCHLQ